MTARGIGLAAAVDLDAAAQSAKLAERLGYHSFWLNNPPGGDALTRLGSISRNVPGLWLGVGVIPLSHSAPKDIVAELERANLPADRLYLGIGSGSGSGGIERVRNGVMALRDLTEGTIVVAALGPRMCRLAGEIADGVLLNWLTPDAARQSCTWVRDGAESAERAMPRAMAYVRVALADDGAKRLAREAGNYQSYPQYAAHFARMKVSALDTAIVGSADEIRAAISGWDGIVDELVLRVVTGHDTGDEIARVIEASAPN